MPGRFDRDRAARGRARADCCARPFRPGAGGAWSRSVFRSSAESGLRASRPPSLRDLQRGDDDGVDAKGKVHDRQITDATAVDGFFNSKYTNGELYDFMLTKLTTIHAQAYQLAVGLAQRANAAHSYELGANDVFIQPDYLDIFDVDLRDERWLPFEGKGAASTWALELRAEDNAFDLATITDVVLHVR